MLFMAGPAGVHSSEQLLEEPRTGHGGVLAWASWIVGSWKWLDVTPVTPARENATAKNVSSFRVCIVLKFSRRGFGCFTLKRLSPERIQGKSRA